MEDQEVVEDVMKYLLKAVGYDGHYKISSEINEILDDLLCKITNPSAGRDTRGMEIDLVFIDRNCELPLCPAYDSILRDDTEINSSIQPYLPETSDYDRHHDAFQNPKSQDLLTLRDCGILNILSRPDYIKPLNLLKQTATTVRVQNENHAVGLPSRSIENAENILKLEKDHEYKIPVWHEINSEEILETVKLWMKELMEINFGMNGENSEKKNCGAFNAAITDGNCISVFSKTDSDLFDTDIAKLTEDWADDQMECEIEKAPARHTPTEIDVTNLSLNTQSKPDCESECKQITADKTISVPPSIPRSVLNDFDKHFIPASSSILNTPDTGCSIVPNINLSIDNQTVKEIGVCPDNNISSTNIENTSTFKKYTNACTSIENSTGSSKSILCDNEDKEAQIQCLLDMEPEVCISDKNVVDGSKESGTASKELFLNDTNTTKLSIEFFTSLIDEVVEKTLCNFDISLVDEKFSEDFDSMLSMTNSQTQDSFLGQHTDRPNEKILDISQKYSASSHDKIDVCSQISDSKQYREKNLGYEIKTEQSQNSAIIPIVKRQLNFSDKSEEKPIATDKQSGDEACIAPEGVLTVERSVDSNISLVEHSILESSQSLQPLHNTSADPVVSSSQGTGTTVTFAPLSDSPKSVAHIACTEEAQPCGSQSVFQIPVEFKETESDKENMVSKKMEENPCKTLKRQVRAIEKDIVDKEETLRKLQLVKIHSQKVNLQEMTELVQKWKNVCKAALIELQTVAVMPDGSSPTMNLLLGHFNIDPQILT